MCFKKEQVEPDMKQLNGSKLGKEYTLSLCLFTSYAEYSMRNTGLNEPQARIKVAGRNINNFRYAGDTTLMTVSEKDLKSLLMRVK